MRELVLNPNDERARLQREHTVFAVILAVSFCHLLNDMMQALLPAIYPNLKADFGLSFGQVGIVTLVYQITASILQPLVGLYADRRPTPLALPGGTLFSLAGLMVLSVAHGYAVLLVGASLLGVGSSVFHPESSRVVRMAAGGRHGLAQSLFQVGGNVGQALGPLAAALVVVRWGQSSLAFFALLALVSAAILWNVGVWYKHHGLARLSAHASHKAAHAALPAGSVRRGMGVLLVLVFSKYVYLASLTSYFTFYLIHRFGLSVRDAQLELFAFSAAVAVGTILGGPFGDRIGRKRVIWFSILGYAAVHADAAVCQPVLDRSAGGRDRADSGVGLSGHRRIRAGTCAGQGRHGVGTVLRVGLRRGRSRRGGPRRARRCLGHRASL